MRENRVTLDLTKEMKTLLDKLAKDDGITLSEVLRRSIALFASAKKYAKQEQAEITVSRNGKILYKLIGF